MSRRLIMAASVVLLAVGYGTLGARDPEQAMGKKELKAAIAGARTPADHQRIAAYYKLEVERLLAEASDHEDLAEEYRKAGNPHSSKRPMAGSTAEHCEYLAGYLRQAAYQADELAKRHLEMAAEPVK